ncbi:MAG: hypothetical protein ACO2PN_20325, partial [Pyrobaculum sp.]
RLGLACGDHPRRVVRHLDEQKAALNATYFLRRCATGLVKMVHYLVLETGADKKEEPESRT